MFERSSLRQAVVAGLRTQIKTEDSEPDESDSSEDPHDRDFRPATLVSPQITGRKRGYSLRSSSGGERVEESDADEEDEEERVHLLPKRPVKQPPKQLEKLQRPRIPLPRTPGKVKPKPVLADSKNCKNTLPMAYTLSDPPIFVREFESAYPHGRMSENHFNLLVYDYLHSLTLGKRYKAILSTALFPIIKSILTAAPHNYDSPTKYKPEEGTSQFRFWAKKHFTLVEMMGGGETPYGQLGNVVRPVRVLVHEKRVVAGREDLYQVMWDAHEKVGHGGRDKTMTQIRKTFSYVPKELVAKFVKMCPRCSGYRPSEEELIKMFQDTRTASGTRNVHHPPPAVSRPTSSVPSVTPTIFATPSSHNLPHNYLPPSNPFKRQTSAPSAPRLVHSTPTVFVSHFPERLEAGAQYDYQRGRDSAPPEETPRKRVKSHHPHPTMVGGWEVEGGMRMSPERMGSTQSSSSEEGDGQMGDARAVSGQFTTRIMPSRTPSGPQSYIPSEPPTYPTWQPQQPQNYDGWNTAPMMRSGSIQSQTPSGTRSTSTDSSGRRSELAAGAAANVLLGMNMHPYGDVSQFQAPAGGYRRNASEGNAGPAPRQKSAKEKDFAEELQGGSGSGSEKNYYDPPVRYYTEGNHRALTLADWMEAEQSKQKKTSRKGSAPNRMEGFGLGLGIQMGQGQYSSQASQGGMEMRRSRTEEGVMSRSTQGTRSSGGVQGWMDDGTAPEYAPGPSTAGGIWMQPVGTEPQFMGMEVPFNATFNSQISTTPVDLPQPQFHGYTAEQIQAAFGSNNHIRMDYSLGQSSNDFDTPENLDAPRFHGYPQEAVQGLFGGMMDSHVVQGMSGMVGMNGMVGVVPFNGAFNGLNWPNQGVPDGPYGPSGQHETYVDGLPEMPQSDRGAMGYNPLPDPVAPPMVALPSATPSMATLGSPDLATFNETMNLQGEPRTSGEWQALKQAYHRQRAWEASFGGNFQTKETSPSTSSSISYHQPHEIARAPATSAVDSTRVPPTFYRRGKVVASPILGSVLPRQNSAFDDIIQSRPPSTPGAQPKSNAWILRDKNVPQTSTGSTFGSSLSNSTGSSASGKENCVTDEGSEASTSALIKNVQRGVKGKKSGAFGQ